MMRSAHTSQALQWIVLVAGIAGASAAGVATYREVGLYGGPVASGFFREWDPATARWQLIHYQVAPSGERIRRVHSDDLAVKRMDLDIAGGTVAIEAKPGAGLTFDRVGFSVANDGVIDAWVTRDPKTGLNRVEVSTKRNGKIDRWEYYEKNILLKVELDTNGNGKPDRWMTYQDGIQMETILDANEDGEPDGQ
jgi:hypothetical protein